MVHGVKTFIKKIQRSEDRTKKAWLIGASSVSLVVVLLLWVAYLNFTLPTFQKTASPEAPARESFFKVFGRGLAVVGDNMSQNIRSIGAKLQKGLDLIKGGVQKTNDFSVNTNADTLKAQTAPTP